MTPRLDATVSCLVSRIARCPVRILFEGRASGAASGQWSFRKGAEGASGLQWRARVEAHRNELRQLRGGESGALDILRDLLDRGSHESEDAGIGFLLSRLLVAISK